MQGFWRHPALPIGTVLLVLGLGNWSVSHSKLMEYGQRISAAPAVEGRSSFADFRRLTERSSATVLDSLHRGPNDYGANEAKRDFYAVMESGGRFLTVIGALLVGVGLWRRWRQPRGGDVAPSPPTALLRP